MNLASAFAMAGRASMMFALLLAGSLAYAVPPVLSGVEVADVTPSSVTLIWDVDQAASVNSVLVYEDAAAAIDITSNFEMTTSPLIGGDPAAADETVALAARAALIAETADKGLVRVRIDGLTPNTTYYLRARSSVGPDVAELPLATTIAVTTANVNTFITRSQQLRLRFDAPGATGWVVMATSTDTAYPVSTVVGDGGADNEAFLNLAHMFTLAGANYEPVGETTVTLRIRQGGGSVLTPSFDVTFIDGFAVGIAYLLDVADPNVLLQMIQPSVVTYSDGATIVLAWTDDLPPSSEISLYYDTDAQGADGTLIVAGLDADADGAADTYNWDTVTVPDGIYRVYAQRSDGGSASTSYAPAPVAIDRAGTDGDADNMSDLWEQLFFGDLNNDGTADGDLDGRIDSAEYADRTTPLSPDFRLRGVAGLNFMSWPIAPVPALTSTDFITSLGGIAESIERINNAAQQTESTTWTGSAAAGANFPIVAEEGYMVRLASSYDGVYVGVVAPAAANLGVGVNLVGFNSLPAGYTAYQLLEALGGEGVVASVAQLDTDSGRYRSATYVGGSTVGFDFPVVQQGAYLIHLKQAVSGFNP